MSPGCGDAGDRDCTGGLGTGGKAAGGSWPGLVAEGWRHCLTLGGGSKS